MVQLARIPLVDILVVVGIMMLVGLLISLALIAWVFFKIRKINLPAGTDFFDALRATPLSVVILLDVLDLGLDIFSAPVAWVVLGKLGLEPLRPVSVVKDLIPIPGLEVLPAMTIAWLIVNQFDKHGSLQSRAQHYIDQNRFYQAALTVTGKRKASRRLPSSH